jgi:hypothetical protein
MTRTSMPAMNGGCTREIPNPAATNWQTVGFASAVSTTLAFTLYLSNTLEIFCPVSELAVECDEGNAVQMFGADYLAPRERVADGHDAEQRMFHQRLGDNIGIVDPGADEADVERARQDVLGDPLRAGRLDRAVDVRIALQEVHCGPLDEGTSERGNYAYDEPTLILAPDQCDRTFHLAHTHEDAGDLFIEAQTLSRRR